MEMYNNSKPIILVTGAQGQLGASIAAIADNFPEYAFAFLSKLDLSINDESAIDQFFSKNQPAVCINCAAYTAVDAAETDAITAFAINAVAPGLLATACKKFYTRFVHVSTDYVFDGSADKPYTETDDIKPINQYGASKAKGEELVLQNNPAAVIIRTSWVYSEFGKNFVKTMLRLMKEKPAINVVNDQLGSPTYATDLALAIMQIAQHPTPEPGIYHFCNNGVTSWYEFALAIKAFINSSCIVSPIATTEYPTPAKRPSYSVLNSSKISRVFSVYPPAWRESLLHCLKNITTESSL